MQCLPRRLWGDQTKPLDGISKNARRSLLLQQLEVVRSTRMGMEKLRLEKYAADNVHPRDWELTEVEYGASMEKEILRQLEAIEKIPDK